MPVVFVHGVNNRAGDSYNAGVAVKEKFFKKYLSGAKIGGGSLPANVSTVFPFWGDLGAKFAWEMESLPQPDEENLGSLSDADLRVLLGRLQDELGPLDARSALLTFARVDFVSAVELVSALLVTQAGPTNVWEVAEFVTAVQAYAQKNPQPAELVAFTQDPQLLAFLFAKAAEQQPAGPLQTQGVGSTIMNALAAVGAYIKSAVTDAGGKVLDRVGDLASTAILGSTRSYLNKTLGQFFGDVFVYLSQRQGEIVGPIPALILKSIDDAIAAAPENEPLVIVGHSLGGVIMFDLLSYYRINLPVDLFVTIGSQVGHFEELKLFRSSSPAFSKASGKKAPTPPNIKRWINIYDPVDIFSYSADLIFDRVDVNAVYDTGTYVIKAHGEYFVQARMYDHLRKRIEGLP